MNQGLASILIVAASISCEPRSDPIPDGFMTALAHSHHCPTAQDACIAEKERWRDTTHCEIVRRASKHDVDREARYRECLNKAKPLSPEEIRAQCADRVAQDREYVSRCMSADHQALIVPIHKYLVERGCDQQLRRLDSIGEEADEEVFLRSLLLSARDAVTGPCNFTDILDRLKVR